MQSFVRSMACAMLLMSASNCGGVAVNTQQFFPKVAFVGDSITDCMFNTHSYCPGPLPGAPWPNAVNLGVAGQPSSQMLANFQSVLDGRPAVIVIQCFCNDWYQNPPILLSTTENNILTMMDMAVNAGSKVVLTSTIPDNFPVGTNPIVNEMLDYNSFVQGLVDNRNVSYADYFTAMSTSNDAATTNPSPVLAPNSLHPSGSGLSLMFPVVQNAINTVLNPAPPM